MSIAHEQKMRVRQKLQREKAIKEVVNNIGNVCKHINMLQNNQVPF